MAESPFGHPSLNSRDVEPLAATRRTLTASRSALLWVALGLTPAAYGAGLRHPGVGFGARMVALAVGVLLAQALAVGLARTARRYGLGAFGPLRAAFGARGAPLALWTRWLAGVLWTTAWALDTAVWSRRLLSAALPQTDDVQVWLQWHLTEPIGLAVATWLLLAVLILLAGWLARGRMRRLRWATPAFALVAVAGLIAVVAIVGLERGSFDVQLWSDDRWPVGATLTLALRHCLMWWPLVIAAPDWARYEAPTLRASAACVGILPGALVMAWFGALLASAAPIILARADMALIPDAAAAGGLWVGLAATVAAWVAFMAAAALVGLHSPALALCAISPRHLPYARALRLTVLAIILTAPLVAWMNTFELVVPALVLTLAPVLGVWLIDECVVRRGRVALEELYLPGRLRLAGLVALVLGWCGELPAWELVQRLHPRLEALSLDWLLGMLIAGVVFGVGAPLEAWLTRPRPPQTKPRVKRHKKRRRTDSPVLLGADDSRADQETNPHFTYKGPKGGDET